MIFILGLMAIFGTYSPNFNFSYFVKFLAFLLWISSVSSRIIEADFFKLISDKIDDNNSSRFYKFDKLLLFEHILTSFNDKEDPLR